MLAIRIDGRNRDLLFFTTPALWDDWPFLPLVRRLGPKLEAGLLYDKPRSRESTGQPTTVFLCNMFALPPTEDDFLALPRESFDSAEAVYAAGWRVD